MLLHHAKESYAHLRMTAVHLPLVIESPLPLSARTAVRDIAEALVSSCIKAVVNLFTTNGSLQMTFLPQICLTVLKQLVEPLGPMSVGWNREWM